MKNSEIPCVRCGTTELRSNGKCRHCANAYATAWKIANQEKVKASAARYRISHKEQDAIYRAANKEKRNIQSAIRYLENWDKAKSARDAWKAENPEKSKAAIAAWRLANPEKLKASMASWKKENPEAVQMHKQNRRARKIGAGGSLSKELSSKLFKLQKGMCPCCKQPLGDNYHLDHKMPLALGGSNTDDNMQLLRKMCNLQKRALHPIDFMQSRGFLL